MTTKERKIEIGRVGRRVEVLIDGESRWIDWGLLARAARGEDHRGLSDGPDPLYSSIYADALVTLDREAPRLLRVRAKNYSGSDVDESAPTWAVAIEDAAGRRVTPRSIGLPADLEMTGWSHDASRTAREVRATLEARGWDILYG